MAKNVTIQRIVSVLLHRIKFIILATVVMPTPRVRHLQRLTMIQPKRQPMRKTRRYILLIFPPLQILLKSALHSLKIPMR